MYRVNIIAYIFLLLCCLICFTYVIPNWTPPYPGFGVPASYVPSVLCGVIASLSAIGLLITLVRKSGSDASCGLNWKIFLHFCLILVPIALSMPLMQILGFMPGAALTVAALQLCVGERRWFVILLNSVLTAGLSYLGLWYGLHLPLP